MIKHYLIDGNNLIGQNRELKKMQGKDGQNAREKLVIFLEKYFAKKKVTVNLYFDGFEKGKISQSRIKIFYSERKPADDLIRIEIANSQNCRTLRLISSDLALCQFARKSACNIQASQDFWREFENKRNDSEEEKSIKSISNLEMMKLFGIK